MNDHKLVRYILKKQAFSFVYGTIFGTISTLGFIIDTNIRFIIKLSNE